MRITIVLRILWPAGAPKIAIQEFQALRNSGHEVELIFLRTDGRPYAYQDLLRDVRYRVLRTTGEGTFTPLFSLVTRWFAPARGKESAVDLDLILRAPSAIDRGTELLICHDQLSGVAGRFAWNRFGIPYSVFVHERIAIDRTKLRGRIADYLNQYAFKHARRIYAITDRVKDTISDFYPNLDAPLVTTYPGFDTIGNPPPFRFRKPQLIAVAMWDPERKPSIYLEVLKALPDYRLVIAGAWRKERNLQMFKSMVSQSDCSDRVTILDALAEDELASLYRESRFAIRFGFGEYGLGTSVTESIRYGTPVILNHDLGTAALIQDFGGGLVASAQDRATIVDFIRHNEDESSYSRLQAGLRRIGETHSWKHHVAKLVGK